MSSTFETLIALGCDALQCCLCGQLNMFWTELISVVLSIQCTGRFKTSPFCAYLFTDLFWNWRSTLALFFRLKPNASSNQFFRDSEILNNPAINVRRINRTHPNWKRVNSAVCWSSSLRKQRSLAAAPIACRRLLTSRNNLVVTIWRIYN